MRRGEPLGATAGGGAVAGVELVDALAGGAADAAAEDRQAAPEAEAERGRGRGGGEGEGEERSAIHRRKASGSRRWTELMNGGDWTQLDPAGLSGGCCSRCSCEAADEEMVAFRWRWGGGCRQRSADGGRTAAWGEPSGVEADEVDHRGVLLSLSSAALTLDDERSSRSPHPSLHPTQTPPTSPSALSALAPPRRGRQPHCCCASSLAASAHLCCCSGSVAAAR